MDPTADVAVAVAAEVAADLFDSEFFFDVCLLLFPSSFEWEVRSPGQRRL